MDDDEVVECEESREVMATCNRKGTCGEFITHEAGVESVDHGGVDSAESENVYERVYIYRLYTVT